MKRNFQETTPLYIIVLFNVPAFRFVSLNLLFAFCNKNSYLGTCLDYRKELKLTNHCFCVHLNGFSYVLNVILITDSGFLLPPKFAVKCKVWQIFICIQCTLYSNTHLACGHQRGTSLSFELDVVIQKRHSQFLK